jgi:hypothetical protein
MKANCSRSALRRHARACGRAAASCWGVTSGPRRRRSARPGRRAPTRTASASPRVTNRSSGGWSPAQCLHQKTAKAARRPRHPRRHRTALDLLQGQVQGPLQAGLASQAPIGVEESHHVHGQEKNGCGAARQRPAPARAQGAHAQQGIRLALQALVLQVHEHRHLERRISARWVWRCSPRPPPVALNTCSGGTAAVTKMGGVHGGRAERITTPSRSRRAMHASGGSPPPLVRTLRASSPERASTRLCPRS